jgi:pimeloyl-ACP methyl ester carboxylesterase
VLILRRGFVAKFKIVFLGSLYAVVALYLAVCGVIFFEQRSLIFQPPTVRLDNPPAGSGYQSLAVAVPDLGTLKDWWMPPASTGMPTVIFFHGNGSDRADFMTLGALLHQRGWGVVLASYRGYSGNPGSPTEAGLMADARATIAAVKPYAGPVILWGHSLGSGIAAQMASEGLADGLVLESAYTSIADVGARLYPYLPVHLLSRDPFDTLSLLGRIKTPVLIFHSVDDPEIPFAMGRQLADRLGGRATFVRMNGVGHYPHSQDISPAVVQWAVRQHLVGR